MYYYCTNSDKIELITEDFSETAYNIVIADARNIPLENAVLLDGQLHDNRELDYWKLAKTKELENYLNNAIVNGYTTSTGIVADCDEKSLSLQVAGKVFNDIENDVKATKNVTFTDFFGDDHELTPAKYKVLLKEIGSYIKGIRATKSRVIGKIKTSKTIEELKAIVI